MNKKAVLYTRVSSKEQKEEGFSISAQNKLLRDYAKKQGLNVVRAFEEAETAKRAGREEFGRMVSFLTKNPSVENILVEKTDRLYRNFRDLVTIDELGRNIHFVKEGQVYSENARSSDKLMHNLKVVLAKNYVDNLSEETKKGMQEKAEQGLYPSFAPLGYVNDKEKGNIRLDFQRATIIKKLFEAYAGGGVSIRELVKLAGEKGLRSRKGKNIQKSQIAKMLQNPIYIGDFAWNGVYYKGRHEPVVSRVLFEGAARMMHNKQRPRKQKRDFAFRGLLKCGVCGCMVTAEIKKDRYVYYRCTRNRQECTEKTIREEALALKSRRASKTA